MNAFDPMTMSIFFGVLIVFICIGYALSGSVLGPRISIERRAIKLSDRLRRLGANQLSDGSTSVSVMRDSSSQTPFLDRLVKKILPRQSMLKSRLARTGRNISIGGYAAINILLCAVTFLIVVKLLGWPWYVALAKGIVIGVGVPHKVVSWLAARRTKAFNDIFPDAIDLIVRGLRSGLPVTESLASVGEEMADPVGYEFRKITDAIKFGQTLDGALWDTANRLDIQEFKFFVISLSVQKETGGNLAETLANLSEILRRRHQMKLKIKAMSSEARASAMILGSLPFIMFGIIFLLNNDYAMDLFTDPRGRALLIAVFLLMSMGILVMRKMVRFEI